MLDMKFVRENLDAVRTMLKNRCNALDLSSFTELDERRRAILQDVEEKKARRNAVSKEIGVRKKAGESADAAVVEMRELGDEIAALDEDLRDVELKLRELLLQIPNMPKADVPIGADETENPEVRRWGTPRTFDFEPQAHWDIGEKLGVLDAERAAKVTGARFTFYKGLGARLERACINFMMDLHAEKHGYTEMLAPYIVNEDSMIGTGQLPKFAEDMFKLDGLDYYLVPTAEVPTTNYHRDEILEAEQLPEYYTSYTACFRAEAGSAGRDTRGLIRQHQFNKVELIKFVTPETSLFFIVAVNNNPRRITRMRACEVMIFCECIFVPQLLRKLIHGRQFILFEWIGSAFFKSLGLLIFAHRKIKFYNFCIGANKQFFKSRNFIHKMFIISLSHETHHWLHTSTIVP